MCPKQYLFIIIHKIFQHHYWVVSVLKATSSEDFEEKLPVMTRVRTDHENGDLRSDQDHQIEK